MITTCPSSTVRLWDDGIRHRTVVVSADDAFLALSVEYVAEKIIRTKNGSHEDDLIANHIRAATELCEHETQTYVRPRRLGLIADGAPWGGFELGRPVRDVVSIDYYDGDQGIHTLSGSPAPWILLPSTVDHPAKLYPAAGASWPSVGTRQDAVTVTFDVGYATPAEIPHMIKTGIGLCAAELYKNPDLSNDLGMAANVLGLSRFWPRRW